MSGWHREDLAALHRGLRNGSVDPVDLLDHYLARIEKPNPALNALITPDPTARAQAEAGAARYRKGMPRGPLDGIPCSIKDNIPQAGMTATLPNREGKPLAVLSAR